MAGEHDRTKSEGTEQYFDISQWCIHGRFDVDLDESYGYDIGLIKLSRSAIMDKTVGLICLPKQNERVPVGKLCYLTGNTSNHCTLKSLLPTCIKY